jgi:hypothetical protein
MPINSRLKIWRINAALLAIMGALDHVGLCEGIGNCLPTPKVTTSGEGERNESRQLIVLEAVVDDVLKRHPLHVGHDQKGVAGAEPESPNLAE